MPPLDDLDKGSNPSARYNKSSLMVDRTKNPQPAARPKKQLVEALADILHDSEKNLLKVDCGEFQMEHEVAKLIGAPPGYLGHRETQPMLTQQKLASVTSERSGLSLVLFDEIEKAAPSLTRLLLGVLDKATL